MTAQRKTPTRRISAKDREFEELLRRAALYAKKRQAVELPLMSRKRAAVA